jgi:predicted MFS family arabinose efflux permease
MQFRGRASAEISVYDNPEGDNPRPAPRGTFSPSSVRLIVLFFTCFAVNSDQLVSAPNLTLISRSFSLTEAERDSHLGALIQFGFFVSAGFFSILAGPIIEVIDRSKLMAVLASFSTILACCSALVPTGRAGFFYFFLIRVSTGISVGMMLPAAFSLLGDLVAVNKRTTMGAFVTTSCAAGAAIGQAIAGLVGGAWRVPYFISGALSAIAGLLCLSVLVDPRPPRQRGTKSPLSKNMAAYAWRENRASTQSFEGSMIAIEDLNWSKFHTVLEKDTNRLVFAQSFPGCIAWSSIAIFLPDFLHKDLGYSVKASTGVMAIFGISGLACALIGSGIGQSIYNRHRKNLPAFVALCIAAGAVPMILLALVGGNGFFTLILACWGGIAATAGPNFKGMLMNANSAVERATVFAMFNLVDNLGKGLGPSVLVMLTWIFGGSRRIAFAIAFGLWFVSAWIALKLEDCLSDDTLSVEIKQGNSENTREPFDLLHLYHG